MELVEEVLEDAEELVEEALDDDEELVEDVLGELDELDDAEELDEEPVAADEPLCAELDDPASGTSATGLVAEPALDAASAAGLEQPKAPTRRTIPIAMSATPATPSAMRAGVEAYHGALSAG